MKTYDRSKYFVYAHFKRDGYNMRMMPDGTILSRGDKDWTDRLAFMDVPVTGVEVHFELWAPGHRASDVVTLVNEESDKLKLSAYRVPILGDAELFEVAEWCLERGLEFIPYFMHHESLKSMGLGGIRDKNPYTTLIDCEGMYTCIEQLDRFMPQDVEGFVFCDDNSSEMQKWKREETLDLIISGIKPGKGTNAGTIGGLKVRTIEGHDLGSVGGLKGDLRALDPESIVGLVIEVVFQYIGNKGKLRHGRLVRFRDDKPAEECNIHQLPELENFYAPSAD